MDARRWRIAGVIALGLIVVGGLVLGSQPDDHPAVVDIDSGDDSDGDANGVEGDLAGFVAEAIDFIEAARNLSFIEAPVVLVLSDGDFVARVDADLEKTFDDDPELVEEFTVLYRALRLIDADETIDEEYRAFGSVGVLGFYDPETDELVVREGDGLSLLTRSTIVHELTHALDDQHFDLDRPEYDDLTDEIPWTFAAVVEGGASYVETRWIDSLSAADQLDLQAEELGFGDASIFDEFTYAFLLTELSIYVEGEPFVARLVADGGTEALDRALAEPPVSSEQVMEPDAWRTTEAPIEVPLPPADGDVVASGVGGQVLIESLLSEVMFGPALVEAADGWGGDSFVAWRDGALSCIRWDLVADTSRDGEELFDGLTNWVLTESGAAISSPSPGVIRVDSCV